MKNRNRRIVSLLLSLVLLLSATGFAALAQAAEAPGFVVKETRRLELVSADVTLYEHVKTGALVMTLINEDTNRTFDITFRTPTVDDRGIPHVFEHATLGGSRKYPSKSLFFNLLHQTYSTFMNAMTSDIMTTFPVASLSEDQLLKYADFYADSVFYPSIMTDESIFLEEAWRYSMQNLDSDLTLAGTVYTEMQGAYTIETAATFNFKKALFPGSVAGNSHGGDPKHIPELTWEDLKTYHDQYYHPSNSLTILYGKLEQVPAFLSLLDGYFSAFEKKDFTFLDPGYTPLTAPVESSFDYAVEAASDTKNGAVVYYGFLCPDASPEDEQVMDLLTTLLNEQSSVFQQEMNKQLPQASASVRFDNATPQTAVIFSATGMEADQAPLFRDVISQALADVSEKGFDLEAVEAVAAATRLSTLLITENANIGPSLAPSIAYMWAATGDTNAYSKYVDNTANYVAFAEEGRYQALIKEFLHPEAITALVVTQPVAGLKETQDRALQEDLAARKAAMTEEELQAIVDSAAAVGAPEADNSAQYIKQLQAVTVDSLPVERRIYDLTDETGEDGVRRITADASVTGVGQVLLLLDAGALPLEDVHWFKLYIDLLGKLDSAQRDNVALSAMITRYLYDNQIRISLFSGVDGQQANPKLRVSFISMDEDLAPAYDLVYELLFETKLDDAGRVLDLLGHVKAALKQTITNSAYNILAFRAFSTARPSFAFFNYANFLDYYAFLEQAENLLEEQPEEALAKLLGVQTFLKNRDGAILGFAGNPDSQQLHRTVSDVFLARLNHEARQKAVCALPEIAPAEALVVDSAVQYNLVFAPYNELGMEETHGALDALALLVSDAYLYPQLREQYGAYAVIHAATEDGVYILSFRDPNVSQTFQIYADLPAFLTNMELDQETLEGYILSAYSAYALSQGELSGALSALLDQVDEKPQKRYLKWMEQLKAITPEDVKAYADMYQKLCDTGYRATAGGAGKINEHAHLYQAILNPFAVKDTGPAVLADVEEGAWYQQAVQFVVDNKLITPRDDTRFGIGQPAALGDFALAFFNMVGGGGTPEEAIAALAGIGMLPAGGKAEDTFTREQLAGWMTNFFTLAGMDWKAELMPLPDFADATEISPDKVDAFRFLLDNKLMVPHDETTLAPQAEASREDIAYLFYALSQE